LGLSLSWRVLAASAIGTSHLADNRTCEDSCWANVDVTPNGPFLSMFVADGAGSAGHGGEGADLAIQAAAEFVGFKLKTPEFAISDGLAADLLTAIRDRIRSESDRRELKVRDFACTFLGLLGSSAATLVMQVGDGGIALDIGNGLEIPIAPMTGEYANMTHFVTEDDAIDVLVAKSYPSQAIRAAIFSDGLQRLAIHMATNTPHPPFFNRFFRVMTESSEENQDEIHNALVRFLQSPSVNERTDDDKTIALAVMV
jgi:Protein phosphatase 2C